MIPITKDELQNHGWFMKKSKKYTLEKKIGKILMAKQLA